MLILIKSVEVASVHNSVTIKLVTIGKNCS